MTLKLERKLFQSGKFTMYAIHVLLQATCHLNRTILDFHAVISVLITLNVRSSETVTNVDTLCGQKIDPVTVAECPVKVVTSSHV